MIDDSSVAAIIQARMGSKRLSGKVLKKIGKSTILEILLKRLGRSKLVDFIVVATTERHDDDSIADLVESLGMICYRGEYKDVLKRFVRANELVKASIIVRVTADNPLTDPQVVDEVLSEHIHAKAQYSYAIGVPLGMGAEVVDSDVLKVLDRSVNEPRYREHVTLYIRENPKLFRVHQVNVGDSIQSRFRVTIDYKSDLRLLRSIYNKLGDLVELSSGDVVRFLEDNPKLQQITSLRMQ